MDHLIDDEIPRHERELTLSTGAILGIFLGLAILCGAFFGFGYNMGRKSAPTPLSLSEVTPDAGVTGVSNGTKPSAGSMSDDLTSPAPPVPTPKPVRRTPPAQPASESAGTESAVVKPAPVKPPSTAATAAAPIVRQPAPVPPSALSPSVASSSATPTTAGTGSYMVQVAAVSHQEDANLLLGALRARGYAVSARSNGADSFIHIQVGPFRDKKEADAMRQRLQTDGYNAIVKQ